ncbi:M20 family metallopeptidase [Stella sp.]|uniref:M20 family metallopeptidase n=1 Tax=Stella sp. TaxID=2912054 RepID=UPI0035AFB6A8
MAAEANEPRIDPDEILAGIREWVEVETPSGDGAAVNRLVSRVETQLGQLGMRITRHPGRDGFGDTLEARSPWGGDGPGILVLAHLDTVWDQGTLARRPFTVEGDRVYGPGIYDMKGGGHLAFYAYRHLVRQGRETRLPITFLFVPEEEVGSPTSRGHIERAAKAARYVLVLEPGRTGNGVVTSRKAWGRFVMTVTGVSAHAGSGHEHGRSAVIELARQILRIEAMTDYARGITTNVGVVTAGGPGKGNVVPPLATAEIDLRAPDDATAAEMVERILALRAIGPDVTVTVEGGINRPPFVRHEGVARLYETARRLAGEMAMELPETSTGGVSDGNFAAALGVPTLDGLGVLGAGAHAEHEHLLYSSLEPRTRLVLRLFEELA